MKFQEKRKGQTNYVSRTRQIPTSKLINEPNNVSKAKESYHNQPCSMGRRSSVLRTKSENSHVLKFLPDDWVLNLLRNNLQHTSSNDINAQAKRSGVQKELIYDHMSDHDNRE